MFRHRYPKKQLMINSINGGAVRQGVRAHTPLQDQPVNKHFVVQALSDVLSQFPGHLHGVDEVRGLFQDGVVGHEVVGADPRVVGIQVDCRAVGCVATAAALGRGEEGVRGRKNTRESGECALALFHYPFPHLTLGLSDRNMGRKCMKSSPSGLCLPLAVIGRQCTQEGFTTGRGKD